MVGLALQVAHILLQVHRLLFLQYHPHNITSHHATQHYITPRHTETTHMHLCVHTPSRLSQSHRHTRDSVALDLLSSGVHGSARTEDSTQYLRAGGGEKRSDCLCHIHWRTTIRNEHTLNAPVSTRMRVVRISMRPYNHWLTRGK